jgi:hypothetical protein
MSSNERDKQLVDPNLPEPPVAKRRRLVITMGRGGSSRVKPNPDGVEWSEYPHIVSQLVDSQRVPPCLV